MFKALLTRFRRPPPEYRGKTPADTLNHHLGELHELTNHRFIPSRTRSLSLTARTDNLTHLGTLLIEASVFCHSRSYIPDHWSKRRWDNQTHTFADYITVDDELVHPLDWIEIHRHYIQKLTAAFLCMDSADREYYQRKCGFLVDDLLTVLKCSKQCLAS